MTALPVAGVAVLLVHASSTYPRLAPQVRSAGQAGAIGIKTGDTKAAGNCLPFEAARNGLTLIGVTLGTPGDDIAVTGPIATRVLNWGFSHF